MLREFLKGGGCHVTDVVAGANESFESLLRRFNRSVQQAGVLAEVRRRGHYEKPSVKHKRKEAAKRRKSARAPRASRVLRR